MSKDEGLLQLAGSVPEIAELVKDKLKAEAEQYRAEAKKANAEARHETAEAVVAEIVRDREKQKRENELAQDDHFRVYRFASDVNSGSAQKCMATLARWSRVDPGCDIHIEFCSPGGSVVDGLALFDAIMQTRRDGHRVITSALGYAASMAGILLQAGERRVMAKESWLLIHEASFGAVGSFGEVEDRVKWIEQIQERILNIFAERSKNSGALQPLSKEQIRRRWRRKDWWVDSAAALKHGLVDEIR